MAIDDNSQDNDQDDFLDDEEDFGLPELDYGALEDDDSDEDTVEEDVMGEDSIEENSGDFYEEESYDDFENSGGEGFGDNVSDSIYDDGTSEDNGKDMPNYEDDEDIGSSKKGNFAKVVIIGILIILGLGSTFWYIFLRKHERKEDTLADNQIEKSEDEFGEKEGTVQDSLSLADELGSDVSESTSEEEPIAKEPLVEKPVSKKPISKKPVSKKPIPKKPSSAVAGTVSVVSQRTGNYFIIIGSFIDKDLANDYMKKLSGEGRSPSMIKSGGRMVKHRVAINKYPTLSKAQGAIEGYKDEFGGDIWVLKY